MIEGALSSRFSISILDNRYPYSVLITINTQINEIRMLQLSKEKLVFNKFDLVFTCLFEPKKEENCYKICRLL